MNGPLVADGEVTGSGERGATTAEIVTTISARRKTQ
jgi:hypothetical protein